MTFQEAYYTEKGYTHAADFDLAGYRAWREHKRSEFRMANNIPDRQLTPSEMEKFRAWVTGGRA